MWTLSQSPCSIAPGILTDQARPQATMHCNLSEIQGNLGNPIYILTNQLHKRRSQPNGVHVSNPTDTPGHTRLGLCSSLLQLHLCARIWHIRMVNCTNFADSRHLIKSPCVIRFTWNELLYKAQQNLAFLTLSKWIWTGSLYTQNIFDVYGAHKRFVKLVPVPPNRIPQNNKRIPGDRERRDFYPSPPSHWVTKQFWEWLYRYVQYAYIKHAWNM